MASLRRKNLIASRRRVEDEGEDDGPDAGELEEDSLSEGSVISDEDDGADGSETSHIEVMSPDSQQNIKPVSNGHARPTNGAAQQNGSTTASPPLANGRSDTDLMLNGLTLSDQNGTVEEVHYENFHDAPGAPTSVENASEIKSTAQMDQSQETPVERRRREHEEYKQKRDADPSFVPNRGAFFMHDHRHAGPAANGFRPFGRGRGRGRGGLGGFFDSPSHIVQGTEATDAPWTHDMHDTLLEADNSSPRTLPNQPSSLNPSTRAVPQAPRGPVPNRSLSTTKLLGNVQLRVLLQDMKEPIVIPGVPIKQYTRLPDHRPPLRRDKPVRISLPDHPPRYIFPAVERSFIFIPRAMRPNQQGFGSRHKPRSALGSIGGFSGQTSIYGGSVYGSVYTPSVAMSRRSSLAYEVPRDNIISPTGSTMSRPPIMMDTTKPVVRLPPSQQMHNEVVDSSINGQQSADSAAVQDVSRPQTYPLPQKPTFRENRPNPIPMHQPRPQKAVSVADIESPAGLSFNPPQQFQQPFHQQVPPQVNGNAYTHDSHIPPHSRNASYPSQASTGTPLSQIPERAIHAQPFQPNPYQQQQGFYPQQYQIMPTQQGFYYPQQYNPAIGHPPPAFVSAPPPQTSFAPSAQSEGTAPQQAAHQAAPANLVAQEVNGMVYYYDASQLPPVATFPAYAAAQSFPMQQVSGVAMQHGMMTPSPDGFYYPQPAQGVVYYPQ